MKKGYVRKIIKFSSIDGPGNRTVIFLQGCNFNCNFCHNPETIKIYQNLNSQESSVKLMNIYEIVESIDEYREFIQGVTISGGECTVQYEFLRNLVMELKRKGYEVIIDTNASLELKRFQQILDYVDYIISDFKVFSEKKHIEITGASNRKVKRNIKIAGVNHKIYEIRTVVIPKVINNKKNIRLISRFLASIDKNISLKLIPYRQLGVREQLLKAKTPTNKVMQSLKAIAHEEGLVHVNIN